MLKATWCDGGAWDSEIGAKDRMRSTCGPCVVRMRVSPCCGLPHIVACFDGNGELGLNVK